MNKRLIRLTESDLHKIVKESVQKILNEIGDTPKGQKALGALHARKQFRDDDDSNDVYYYAEKARGGDSFDNIGDNTNPLYKDFCKGWYKYQDSHPYEMSRFSRKHGAVSTEVNPYTHKAYQYTESVNNKLKEGLQTNHNSDYMEAKQIIDGMNFEDVKNLPNRDPRFSFGTLNGNEGEGMIDLNFKGILVTVKGIAKVMDNYEKYDEGGQFLGLN